MMHSAVPDSGQYPIKIGNHKKIAGENIIYYLFLVIAYLDSIGSFHSVTNTCSTNSSIISLIHDGQPHFQYFSDLVSNFVCAHENLRL